MVGQSTAQETSLRAYYQKLLNLSTGQTAPALLGQYYSLMPRIAARMIKATESNSAQNMSNQKSTANETGYDDSTFAFARFWGDISDLKADSKVDCSQ